MRKKLIVGNWKMNGLRRHIDQLTQIDHVARTCGDVDVRLALPATLIAPAAASVHSLAIGAQDVHTRDDGPYTGCVSAEMVRDAGARFTIVGHSERRDQCRETNDQIAEKIAAAVRHRLGVVLCVGETHDDHVKGDAESVVRDQISCVLRSGVEPHDFVIAYEPLWAIGTGLLPCEEDIGAVVCAMRRELLALKDVAHDEVRLVYGGSVIPGNICQIMSIDGVDGVLVGAASREQAAFSAMIRTVSTRSS
jgi:triosephosphate isomerase